MDFIKPDRIKGLDLGEFYAVLKWNAMQMLSPNLQVMYTENTQVGCVKDFHELNAGFVSMKRLNSLIEGLKSGEDSKSKILRLSDMFGQIAEQTELHYWFLLNMGKQLSLPKIVTLSDEMQYISQKWSVLRAASGSSPDLGSYNIPTSAAA